MTDKLIIFDTTLRDGEQSPGASMTREEKLRIARQLERLRVDVIEAGFAASNGDFEAVRRSPADQGLHRLLAGARQRPRHQPRRRGAGRRRPQPHPHLHRHQPAAHGEEAAHDAREVLEQARLSVRFARNLCDDIEFSPRTATARNGLPGRVVEAVIAEGATTINIPTPWATPFPSCTATSSAAARAVPNSDKAIWSVHCHNDLGMAVANSLAGVKIGGARQVECTINGLGERAGNCSLEEVVMAVKTRRDYFGLEVGIDTTQIVPASRWSARPPASWCSPTRPWSAPTPSPTPPASTRTACSRRATPTRSCAPRTWAGPPTRSCWASSGRNAFKQRLQELGVDVESKPI
jgi:2-isopropylmalate synthase